MQIDTTNLAALDDADWQTLVQTVQAEQARRNITAGYAARQAAAQAAMQAAISADTTAATAYDATTVYEPGQSVTDGGVVYWWPGPGTITNDTPPTSTHWVELPGQGAQSVPFTAGMHLTPQMLVTNAGHTWRYLGADTASAPANWAPTVANATWALIA